MSSLFVKQVIYKLLLISNMFNRERDKALNIIHIYFNYCPSGLHSIKFNGAIN